MEKLRIGGGRGDFPILNKILGYSGNRCPERMVLQASDPSMFWEFWDDLDYLGSIGDLETLILLGKRYGISPGRSVLIEAVKHGKLSVIKWMYRKGWKHRFTGMYMEECIHLEVVKWFVKKNMKPPGSLDRTARHSPESFWMSLAITAGKLPVIQWLEQYCPFDETFQYDCLTPNIEFLEWIESREGKPIEISKAKGLALNAAMLGDIKLLEWLKIRGVRLDTTDLARNLETLLWLESNGSIHTQFGVLLAFSRGNFEMVKHFVRWGNIPRIAHFSGGLYLAFNKDSLSILKWLDENGVLNLIPSEELSLLAAREGDIPLLEFLISKGCPIPKHWVWKIPDWSEAHGLFPTQKDILSSVGHGNFPIFERYVISPDALYPNLLDKCAALSMNENYPKIFKRCLESGANLEINEIRHDFSLFPHWSRKPERDSEIQNAIECLDLAMKNSIHPSPILVDNYASRGKLGICKFLASRNFYPSIDSIWSSASNGHLNILQWFFSLSDLPFKLPTELPLGFYTDYEDIKQYFLEILPKKKSIWDSIKSSIGL